MLLHDAEAGEILIPSVLGNPDRRGHSRTASVEDLASTKMAIADKVTVEAAAAAARALGGRPTNDGYVRLPAAACGALEYCLSRQEALFSDDIRADPRFTNAMPPSASAASVAADRGLALGSWSAQQKHIDALAGLPDRTRSLAVAPVVDGAGAVLAILFVANKMSIAGKPAPSAAGGASSASTALALPGGKAAAGGDGDDDDEEGDEGGDGVGDLPRTSIGGRTRPSTGGGALAAASSSGFDADDDDAEDAAGGGVGGRVSHVSSGKNRRLTGLRTWTLQQEAAAVRKSGAGLLMGSGAAAGAVGGAGGAAARGAAAAGGAGGSSVSGSSAGGGAATRRDTSYTDAPVGTFSMRDEEIVAGMAEALAMALDDRRVELETVFSSKSFTPLVDVRDYFRLQLNSVIHVPLPGAKAGSAIPQAAAGGGAGGPDGASGGAGGGGAGGGGAAAKRGSSRALLPASRVKAATAAAASEDSVPRIAVSHKVVGNVSVAAALYHGSTVMAETKSDLAPMQAELDRVAGACTWNTNLAMMVRDQQLLAVNQLAGRGGLRCFFSQPDRTVSLTRFAQHSGASQHVFCCCPAHVTGIVCLPLSGAALCFTPVLLLPMFPLPSCPTRRLQVRFCNLPLASRVIFNVSYKDGTPVGWAGVNVFTAQQVLRSGTLVLPLWPGKLTPENILRITNLANTHAHPDGVPSLVITLHTFEKTVVRLGPSSHMLVSRSYERPHHPGGMPLHDSEGVPNADYIALRATVGEYASVRDRVAHLVRQDPLYKLTPDDAALLWRCRDFMTGASHCSRH